MIYPYFAIAVHVLVTGVLIKLLKRLSTLNILLWLSKLKCDL